MKESIDYNGPSPKRRFNKIKKHAEILTKRLSFSRQKKEIERINNSLLNVILESIMRIKNNDYSDADFEVFKSVDAYREELLNNSEEVSYEIFNSSATRKIKDICRVSASPKVWGKFLYFISKLSESKVALEIGTNVGISGSYILNGMKFSANDFKFVTMEGLSQLCTLCEKQFATITKKENFEVISGLYDDTFPTLIERKDNFDFLFIDGNHQKDPTLTYFEQLKNCMGDKAIFVFDDIYYNTDMTEAWRIIKKDKSVNFSIDMYKWGIVIIDKSEPIKQKSFGIHLSYE